MLIALFIYVAVIIFSGVFTESDNLPKNEPSDQYVPCEADWYYFREKCYKAWGRGQKTFERLPWVTALGRCRNYGGDLVSIQSQEEQDFLISFLQLDVKSWVWIGLNDRDRESNFKWTDGSDRSYENWNAKEPSRTGGGKEDEDCVHMIFEPENNVIGKWNDRSCSVPETYICEKQPSSSKKSANPMYCSPEAGGGWKFHNSCYHVVTEMKSWHDAEKYCKDSYNGHLVSILDTLEDLFLDYILANTSTDLWIGIKLQDQLQQKWSSGWFVAYEDFSEGQLNSIEGTCAARKRRKEWVKLPCTQQLPFICKVSEESPPVLKSPARDSYCPKEFGDWRDLDGEYCYYFEKEITLNFYEALFYCKRRGGNLVSLHSEEENYILLPFVKYVRRSVFIGLVRRLVREEEFTWTDGSTTDYENWNTNEPNNKQEKCVEAITHDNPNGKIFTWNDIPCEEKRSFICSVKKISSNSIFEEDECTYGNSSNLTFSKNVQVEDTSYVSLGTLIGVCVCFFLVILFLGVVMYYFQLCGAGHRRNTAATCTTSVFLSANRPRNRPTSELPLKNSEMLILEL